MVGLKDLQIKEKVTLYKLVERSYREGASGAVLYSGGSEPIDENIRMHGVFASDNGKAI